MNYTSHHARRLASVDALERVWLGWRISIHVLVMLLALVVFVNDGFSVPWAVFMLVYTVGGGVLAWVTGHAFARPANGTVGQNGEGKRQPQWAWTVWVFLVLLSWVWVLVESASAGFVAFALFFLAINTLRPKVAVPTVLIVAAIAIYGLGRHNGWTIGGVVGPLVGALVACVLGFGFLQLRREAFERSRASKLAGEVGERARLAGEIHDTVAQGLSSIQMLLHSLERRVHVHGIDDPELWRDFALVRQTADDNLQETRRIIAALQPGPLMDATLPVALARVVSGTPLGQRLSFTADGTPRALGEQLDSALIRITQSLVANVVQHSGAERARVTLTYEPAHVSLDVVDNGCGFDPVAMERQSRSKSSAEGLAGVKTRAEALGGELSVETAPGQGCGVSVRVPSSGN